MTIETDMTKRKPDLLPIRKDDEMVGPVAGNNVSAVQATDITKSKPYALTDLLAKVVSGFAIVVIGVASCRLQKSQDDKRAEEAQRLLKLDTDERAERKYLPALRSITETDLILAEAAADYSWRKHTEKEATEESRLGTHLAYCGSSLFFPDGEPTFGLVTAIDNQNGATNPITVSIPARAAVLMLANLMRLSPLFQRLDSKNLRVVYRSGELEFIDRDGRIMESSSVDRRTVAAWNAWLPANGMGLHELSHEVDIDTIADDLHAELGKVAENIVNKNPEVLSSEYVKIRDEVLKSRDSLLPTKEQ